MPFAELSFETMLPVVGAFLVTAVPLWLSARKAWGEAAKAERDAQITGLKELIDGYRTENNVLRERLAVMESEWRKEEAVLRREMDLLLDYIQLLKREIVALHPEVTMTTLDDFRSKRGGDRQLTR